MTDAVAQPINGSTSSMLPIVQQGIILAAQPPSHQPLETKGPVPLLGHSFRRTHGRSTGCLWNESSSLDLMDTQPTFFPAFQILGVGEGVANPPLISLRGYKRRGGPVIMKLGKRKHQLGNIHELVPDPWPIYSIPLPGLASVGRNVPNPPETWGSREWGSPVGEASTLRQGVGGIVGGWTWRRVMTGL